eukprot:m.306469 g.306469  ORF g.306469 m.306469 type:complete len:1252 (+) comp41271_c0_seq1:220-3975(+)
MATSAADALADDGQDELVGLDAQSYTPTYGEAFPPLESASTTMETPKGAWGPQAPTIRTSTVTQIFTVPLEERRYREMNDEQFGENKQTHQICRVVMEKTGCSIQLSLAKDQSLTFVLSGKVETVLKARKLILAQIQTQYTVELKIPKEHHRFILGPKYQNLKQLELQTGTKITVPKSDDPSEVLKIAGTKDNVEKARHEIQVKSDERAKLAFERVVIPKVFHPWISGSWQKQAQSVTGARINIPPLSVGKDEIAIAGEKEAVAQAKAMVMKMYQEKERKATSVSVEVKKSQHKYVCGPRRNNLQEIMDLYDVSVEVPPIEGSSETITLRGEPDKLGLALTKVYEKANSVVTAGVDAPRWLHRFIIGRKGQNINKITQDLPEVHIEFSSDKDQIQLEGPPGEVDQARSALESFTKKLMETMDFAVVEVDQKYHRHVIGRGGSNVSRIKRETGTSIMIPPDEEQSRLIRIEGSPTGVAQAKRELTELSVKLENERVRDVKLEHRFHRQVIGTQGQHIKEIRDQFEGVTINFPDSKSGSDIVTLRGPQGVIDKCFAHFKKLNADLVTANYVAEVRVFKQFHRNVIGRGGAMIRKIRDETHTKIDMPTENSDSDVILVTGKKENVEEARKRIEAIQNEQANIITEEIAIPSKLHQAVIGPKGRLVKAISDECGGVTIRFPTGKQAGSDKVIVRGPKDDVESAKKQLLELANERALENFSAEVKAKPEFHRYLIGRGGTNIRKVKEQTGARIIFPNEKDDDRSSIIIIGKEESVKKATVHLEKLIKELENISEAEVTVPQKFHRNFIQRRGQVLQDLADQFGGVSISFPKSGSSSEKVIVKGAKDCVDGAKGRILEIVEELESQVTIECEIPQKHHRTVLGAKGVNVQQVRQDFSVTIKFPERVSGEPNASSNIILITGQKEKAEEAQAALLDLVPVSEEVDIPFDYHRFIIGSRGKDVRQMMEEFGVHIAIPPSDKQSNCVTVSGSPAKVAEAKKALAARVLAIEAEQKDRGLRNFKLQVTVDSRHHPRIIGRKGATISQIRSDYDVNVQFPERGASDPDMITVTGYEDRAEAAKEAILKIVNDLEMQVTKEIEIDTRVHSRLIGARGKAIRKVMDDHRVDIRFPRDKESGLVTVTGLEDDVEDALDYLLNLEEEYLQDVIERLDEEEMLRQYSHPPTKSTDNDGRNSSGPAPGFVVRDAPWAKANSSSSHKHQKQQQQQQPPPPMNPDEFPSIGGGSRIAPPSAPAWGPSKKA